MKRFKWKKTISKGLTTGITFLGAFGAGVSTIDVPLSEAAIPGTMIAIFLAGLRAYNNVRKNGGKAGGPGDPFKKASGYCWVVIVCLAAQCVTLNGCITTETGDGATSHRLDPVILMEMHRIIQSELDRRRANDAIEDAEAEAERAEMERRARAIWEQLQRELDRRRGNESK